MPFHAICFISTGKRERKAYLITRTSLISNMVTPFSRFATSYSSSLFSIHGNLISPTGFPVLNTDRNPLAATLVQRCNVIIFRLISRIDEQSLQSPFVRLRYEFPSRSRFSVDTVMTFRAPFYSLICELIVRIKRIVRRNNTQPPLPLLHI